MFVKMHKKKKEMLIFIGTVLTLKYKVNTLAALQMNRSIQCNTQAATQDSTTSTGAQDRCNS